MPSSRELKLMLVACGLFLLLADGVLQGGLSSDWLLVAPLVVLIVPLMLGRYVGEERLTQLRAARAARAPGRLRRPLDVAPRRAPQRVALRGRLVAAVHASRPPPRRALLTA